RKVDTGKTLKRWPVFVDHYTRINIKDMVKLIDLDKFRPRVEAVAADRADPELQEFLEVWKRIEQGQED
ncbi:hypothetical protein CJP72_18655, partial [Citrobacter sp. NCU1]|uniref:hypothetical protein n=1 Tax=Citrobacter sp. NCU1 TaxID=2026683 RepID=UPI001EE28A0B